MSKQVKPGVATIHWMTPSGLFSPSRLLASVQGTKIIDVNINIDMVHTWVEDLEIRLRAPRHDGLLFEIVLTSIRATTRPLR
jgi:subtilisin-like proprotein convertase family protein